MTDLEKTAEECLRELAEIGISCGKVHSICVNTRAKKRWGSCKPTPAGFDIEIAAVLLGESIPLSSLKNTLIHELLHTCPGCANHGAQWKRLAERVNRAYGYGIQRAATSEEKGVPAAGRVQAKYCFVCTTCGQEIERIRRSKFTENYTRYRCGKCGGSFRKRSTGEKNG